MYSLARQTKANQVASSNTGLAAIQLAKLVGLKVIAVADAVRHGARLSDLGVDILVDRQDPSRAIEIIRNVTKGNNRFGMDTVGKETAAYLQKSLQSFDGARQAHLVGLTGLPKAKLSGVKHHSIPIKIFHEVPDIGDQAVRWLEGLLVDKVFQPPEVDIADGGLEGINGALDRLRNGSISGKRLVVEIRPNKRKDLNENTTDRPSATKTIPSDLSYADKINEDPSRIKFA